MTDPAPLPMPGRRRVLGALAGSAAAAIAWPAWAGWRPGGEVIDVTAAPYGANPDSADNSAAFQAALQALVTAGGGLLRVPAGLYRLRAPLAVAADVSVSLFGDGQDLSILAIEHDGVGFTYTTGVMRTSLTLRDLGFRPPATLPAAAGAVAVDFPPAISAWPGCTIENCDFAPGGGGAFRTVLALRNVFNSRIVGCNYAQAPGRTPATFAALRGRCVNTFIDQCHAAGLACGLRVEGYGEGLHVTDSAFVANGTPSGVGLTTGTGDNRPGGHLNFLQILISNCEFQSNGTALSLYQVKGAQIVNTHLNAGAGSPGPAVALWGSEAQFQNCYVDGHAAPGRNAVGFYLGRSSAGIATYNTTIENVAFENVSSGVVLGPGTLATLARDIRLYGPGLAGKQIASPLAIGAVTWQPFEDRSGNGSNRLL